MVDSPNHSVATQIKHLKKAVLDNLAKRGRLPQPLFWSLFHLRLTDLKKEKEVQRLANDLLDGS